MWHVLHKNGCLEKEKKIEEVVGIYVIKIPSKYIDLIICSRIFVPFSS